MDEFTCNNKLYILKMAEALSSVSTPSDSDEDYIDFMMELDLYYQFNISNHLHSQAIMDFLFDIDSVFDSFFDELGPSPLPRSEIEHLPIIKISKEHVETQGKCSVCLNDFSVGDKAKCLPCNHFYHEKCITPWLEQKAVCPNCRKPVESKKSENG